MESGCNEGESSQHERVEPGKHFLIQVGVDLGNEITSRPLDSGLDLGTNRNRYWLDRMGLDYKELRSQMKKIEFMLAINTVAEF